MRMVITTTTTTCSDSNNNCMTVQTPTPAYAKYLKHFMLSCNMACRICMIL